jgi:hypothetical protein
MSALIHLLFEKAKGVNVNAAGLIRTARNLYYFILYSLIGRFSKSEEIFFSSTVQCKAYPWVDE